MRYSEDLYKYEEDLILFFENQCENKQNFQDWEEFTDEYYTHIGKHNGEDVWIYNEDINKRSKK